MILSRASSVAVSLGVMLSLLAVPSVGHAGPFDCLFPPATVSPVPSPTFMPTTVQRVSWMPTIDPAACNPCGQQITYAPETKRRWTYSRIPKTTFKPVTKCDPCTGCPVTTYQPVTTYSLLPWLRRESYTVYKQVATPMASYNSGTTNYCNSCGGGGSAIYTPGTSGCSTCAPGATLSGTIGSPGSSAAPTSDPYYSGEKKKTFREELRPKPDPTMSNRPTSVELPELGGPGDRAAARPILPPARVRTVSWEHSAAPASPSRPAAKRKLDVSGWRAVID